MRIKGEEYQIDYIRMHLFDKETKRVSSVSNVVQDNKKCISWGGPYNRDKAYLGAPMDRSLLVSYEDCVARQL